MARVAFSWSICGGSVASGTTPECEALCCLVREHAPQNVDEPVRLAREPNVVARKLDRSGSEVAGKRGRGTVGELSSRACTAADHDSSRGGSQRGDVRAVAGNRPQTVRKKAIADG